MAMDFQDVLRAVAGLSDGERSQLTQDVLKATASFAWVPNPGPQSRAFASEADELFYGGQAGGGKSDLAIGLSLTEHRRSLILRRFNNDALSLSERAKEALGERSFEVSKQPSITLRYDDHVIDFSGCKEESDKQRFKGDPHDLICFDEVGDFLESQYEFIKAWNRSTRPGQRCRVLATGNPPTTAEGLWVIRRWAAWLDDTHPNPAKEGELRYYTTGPDGKEIEVDGPGPHSINGQMIRAKSRTFIRAKLSDNPDLAATDYDATLAALPQELRDAYREGNFRASLRDDVWQVIPTAWIRAAQQRWTQRAPDDIPMCAMGVDPAQGGADDSVIAWRHDGWYAPLLAVPGVKTPLGSDVAGLVLSKRRDHATIVLDMGGGYGGGVYQTLLESIDSSEIVTYKGAEKSTHRTAEKKLGFINKRSETYWKFREALNPDQLHGSPIALPEDPMLVADLTAPKYEIGPRGIQITEKTELVKSLGRSPDRGDAVVMCWAAGARHATHGRNWEQGGRLNAPRVDLGRRHNRAGTPGVDLGRRR
jgi:hypothetical protein